MEKVSSRLHRALRCMKVRVLVSIQNGICRLVCETTIHVGSHLGLTERQTECIEQEQNYVNFIVILGSQARTFSQDPL